MVSNLNPLYFTRGATAQPGGGGGGGGGLFPPAATAAVAAPYFPVPAVTYPSAPGALTVGKFPSPRNVFRTNFAGSNKEAQAFLSRGGQVIIRMRGLPYDCTAKQVVS